MAKKQVGRREYLGIQRGGTNYFVKYCDHCGSHVYLTEVQLAELREVTDKWFMYQKNRLLFMIDAVIENIKIPRINFAFKSNEDLRRERLGQEVIRINQEIEYHNVVSNNQLQRIEGFDPIYFNNTYQEYGGVGQLVDMFEQGKSYTKIAEHFHMSKARIGQIKKAIDGAGGVQKLLIKPHI